MAIAAASQGVLRFEEEVTWGTTVGTTGTALRIVSEDLANEVTTVESREIISDRQSAGPVRTQTSSAGTVNFEATYGTFDDLLAGALAAAWETNTPSSGTDRLRNGTTAKSFTLEKQFADLSLYEAYTGCRVNEFALNVTPGQILTGSLSFMGKFSTPSGTSVFSGSAAAPTNTPMNAVDNVTAIKEGGSAINGITNWTFRYGNNLRLQPQIASLAPRGVGLGPITAAGTLDAYFEDESLYTKFINFTASSTELDITDAEGNAYTFQFPKLKYVTGRKLLEGKENDVLVRFTWVAYKDSATGKTLAVTRAPA